MLQVPKNYHGTNSIDSDYIIEPGVNDWKTALYTTSLPLPNTNILDPIDPLPNQLPMGLNEMYKSAIDQGHATFLRQLLRYRGENAKKLNPLIASYAMQCGYPTIVKVMLDFGINPNGTAIMPYTKSRNRKNHCTTKNTFLHRASHRLDGPTMQLLVQHGAAVNARNSLER